MKRPVAERISKWDKQTEIIYQCSKCHTSFAILGRNELFCHTCGEKQDWTVAGNLKEPLRSEDIEEEKKIIAEINKQNKEGRYV